MLVIISDLHFTDGSSGQTIGADAFRIFKERINELAYRASRQKGDTYKPIERIDILLLGDILDIIRSDYWLSNPHNVRPWSNLEEEATIDVIEEITCRMLEYNKEALGVFRELQGLPTTPKGVRSLERLEEENTIRLPMPNLANMPAMRGKTLSEYMPASFREVQKDKNMRWQKVEVKVHYMVGNHDWFFHLKGDRYNHIRQLVIDAMGLANRADEPFAHEPYESVEIMKVLRQHKVFARHGDIYDPFNFGGNRDEASLGDAVVIELVNKFPKVVRETLEGELPEAFLEGLLELDNVRPIFYIPLWISGLLDRTVKDEAINKKVKRLWNQMVKEFMKIDFVRNQDKYLVWDEVDKLQLALGISKLSFDFLGSLAIKFRRFLTDPSSDSFSGHAFREEELRCDNDAYNYVVYGHTHHFEMVPLRVCETSNGTVNKVYLNSGTFRPVHDLVSFDKQSKQFFNYKVMTYLTFYKDGERKGRGFEVWNGNLGM